MSIENTKIISGFRRSTLFEASSQFEKQPEFDSHSDIEYLEANNNEKTQERKKSSVNIVLRTASRRGDKAGRTRQRAAAECDRPEWSTAQSCRLKTSYKGVFYEHTHNNSSSYAE